MLIICNGTFKSGSTWLHVIICEILKIKKIKIIDTKEKYTNNIYGPTTIVESKLSDFLKTEDYSRYNYVTKSHFYKKSTLRRNYDDSVKFIFIHRDLKDAIVSHYYHIKQKYYVRLKFNTYFNLIGRYKAYEIAEINNMYLYYFNSNQIFSYEDLLLSFDDNVRAISTQLSLGNLSDEEILGIKKQTSINSMRDQLEKGESTYYSTVKRNKSRLIRKGKSGDWRNHFKSQHLEDIYRIENGKFSIFNKLVYIFIFSLRRIIFRIE